MPIHPMLRDMIKASIGWTKHDVNEPCPVDPTTNLFVRYKDNAKSELIMANAVDWKNVDEYKFAGSDPYSGRGNNMRKRKTGNG